MPANPLAPAPAAKLEPGDLVDETRAAETLGVSAKTLQNWRALRKGPRYRKIGARLVRYHVDDLAEFQKVMACDAGEAAA